MISKCFSKFKDSKDRLKLLQVSSKRIQQELNVIKMIRKIRLSMEIAKLQLEKNDILTLQKGKHSVIDINTSEPSDIESVQTDPSSEEKGVIGNMRKMANGAKRGLKKQLSKTLSSVGITNFYP